MANTKKDFEDKLNDLESKFTSTLREKDDMEKEMRKLKKEVEMSYN